MPGDRKIDEIATMSPVQRLLRLVSSVGFIASLFLAVTALILAFAEIATFQENNLIVQQDRSNKEALLIVYTRLIATQANVERSENLARFVANTANEISSADNERPADIELKSQKFRDMLIAINELKASNEAIMQSNKTSIAIIEQTNAIKIERRSDWNLGIVNNAYAQGSSSTSPASMQANWTIDSLRPTVMVAIISAITVFFLFCIVLYCFATDAEKLKFADNMMRTIVGFYTGIVTGLLGLPT